MESIYKVELTERQEIILEALRKKIAEIAGVTLQGNRLTVRFSDEEASLVDVHMIIESIVDYESEGKIT